MEYNIKMIEGMSETQAKEFAIETLDIKGHNCYIVDFGGYFKYSILVFKNNYHIYYANDYELHNKNKTHNELRAMYIEKMNRTLFTEEELLGNIHTYDEYTKKEYYVRNYWIQSFVHVPAFYIGEPNKKQRYAKKHMIYNPYCFCYVEEQWIIVKANEYLTNIKAEYSKLLTDRDKFTSAIKYEFDNHEVCYGREDNIINALDTLGLRYSKLEDWQKAIVKREADYQMWEMEVV